MIFARASQRGNLQGGLTAAIGIGGIGGNPVVPFNNTGTFPQKSSTYYSASTVVK